MAITRVATAAGAVVNGTSGTTMVSSAFAVNVGDVIWVAFRWVRDGTQALFGGTPVVDTAANAYTGTSAVTHGVNRLQVWYTVAANAHASNVVTGTLNGASTYRSVVVGVYRGNNLGIDTASFASGTADSGTAAVTSSAFDTIKADSMLLAAAQYDGVSSTWSADSGWAIAAHDGNLIVAIQEKLVSGIQSGITTTMTSDQSTGSKSILGLAINEDPPIGSNDGYIIIRRV